MINIFQSDKSVQFQQCENSRLRAVRENKNYSLFVKHNGRGENMNRLQ